MRKRINKILWHGDELLEEKAKAPGVAMSADGLDGLNEGEIYISNNEKDPALFIRTSSGKVVRVGVNYEELKKLFLSKTDDDTAEGLINFEKGVRIKNLILKVDENNVLSLTNIENGKRAHFAASGTVSSLGVGTTGGGGGSSEGGASALYQLLDVLSDGTKVEGAEDGSVLTYDENAGKWKATKIDIPEADLTDIEGQLTSIGQLITALQGKDTEHSNAITALQQKDGEIEAAIGSNTKGIESLQVQLNTLVSGDASDAIDTFNEVVAFLKDIEDTETLEGILAGKQNKINANNKLDYSLLANTPSLADFMGGSAIGGTASSDNFSAVYWDGKQWQTRTLYKWALASAKPSYTTSEVTEGTRLYFTDDRAKDALKKTTDALSDRIAVFEKMFQWGNGEDSYVKTPYSLASDGTLSSLGVGSSEGGGVSYNRLDSWDSYTDDKAGYVLSAVLGWDLKARLDNLDLGDFDLSGYLTKSEAQNTYATIIALNGKQNAITANNKLSASLVSGLSTVATSGKYSDLSGLPTLGTLASKNNLVASDIPSLSWSKITSDKPTTLSGYGITNALQTDVWIDVGIEPSTNKIGLIQNTGAYACFGWGTSYTMSFKTNGEGLQVKNVHANKDSGWNTLIHSGNFSSYALPLIGGEISGNLTVREWLAVQDVIYAHKGLEVSKTIKGIAENDDETWSINGDTGAALFDSIKIGSSPSIYKADNNALVVAKSGVSYKTSTKGNTLQVISQGAVGIDWSTAIIAFGGESYNVVGSGVGLSLGGYAKGNYADAPIGRGVGIAAVSESIWYNITGLAFFTNSGTSDSADHFTEKIRLTAYGSLIPKHNTSQVLGNRDNRWSYVYSANGDFSGSVTIGDAKIWWDATNKVLRTNVSFASDKTVSSLGVGSESGGGGGSADWGAVPTSIIPVVNGEFNLGTAANRWNVLYANGMNITDSVVFTTNSSVIAYGTFKAASIDGDLMPSIDGEYNIGSPTMMWDEIYANGVNASVITEDGLRVATKNWVESNYILNSALDNYVTKTGYQTISGKKEFAGGIDIRGQLNGWLSDGEYRSWYIDHEGNGVFTSLKVGGEAVALAKDIPSLEGYATQEFVTSQGYMDSDGVSSVIKNYATDNIQGKYLLLTGGSLYDTKSDTPLNIKGGGTAAYIGFQLSNGTNIGSIGVNDEKVPLFYSSQGTYSILHKGNTSYSPVLTSGTKIGTITIGGTATDLYAPVGGGDTSGLQSQIDEVEHNLDLLTEDFNTLNDTVGGLATVATSGDYNDLSNKPTIPSLTGYATQSWVNSNFATTSTFNTLNNSFTSLNYYLTANGSVGQVLTKKSGGYEWKSFTVDWSNVSSKPTTLSGYGITDALKVAVPDATFPKEVELVYYDDIYIKNALSVDSIWFKAGFTMELDSNLNLRYDGSILLHENNFSSYALPLSGGQMDRNTGITWANGYYDSDAVGSHLSVLADTTQDNSLATQTGHSYNAILNVGGGGIDSYRFQLASYAGGGNLLFYRGYNGNSNIWADWVSIIHSGNIGSQSVASAQEVRTADDKALVQYNGVNTLYIGNGIYDTSQVDILGSKVVLRYGASATTGLILNSNGNVTIGSSDLADSTYKLYVNGNSYVNGTLLVTNGIGLARNEANYIWANGGSSSYLLFGVSNVGQTSWANASLRITTVGNVEISKSLTVSGTSSFNGDLTVNANQHVQKVSGCVGIAMYAGLSSTVARIDVVGTDGNWAANAIELGATGDVKMYHNATISGDTSLSSSLTVQGKTELESGLDVIGLIQGLDSVGGDTTWKITADGSATVKNITIGSNERIQSSGNNFYIGNASNAGWVGMQDICSQDALGDSKWSIRTDGAAVFQSLKVGTYDGLNVAGTYLGAGSIVVKETTPSIKFLVKSYTSDYTSIIEEATANVLNINGQVYAKKGGNVAIGTSTIYNSYKLYVNGATYFKGNSDVSGTLTSAGARINDGNLTGGYDGVEIWSISAEGAASFKSLTVNGVAITGGGSFNGGTVANATIFNDNVVIKGENEGFRMRTLTPTAIDFSYGQDYITLRGFSGTSVMWTIDSESGSADFNDYVTASSFEQSSDINLKNILGDVRLSLGTMANAPLVRFDWKNKTNKKHHVGTIAQYWDACLPEVVSTTTNGTLALGYGELGVAMGISLAKEMTEMLTRIDNTNSEVDKLKKRISELEKEIENLKSL